CGLRAALPAADGVRMRARPRISRTSGCVRCPSARPLPPPPNGLYHCVQCRRSCRAAPSRRPSMGTFEEVVRVITDNLFAQVSILIGLIALVGLVLQRKPFDEVEIGRASCRERV